jgi:biotin carboxyl carrier protein
MKITVKIEGQPFEVEIGDLYQRPVIATVDGEQFEVWPEGEEAFKVKRPTRNGFASPLQNGNSHNGLVKNTVVAPIPGLIISVSVKAGDKVTAGQEICVLEAMKMKNTIRSPQDGRVEGVKVATGHQVSKGDVIVAFEDGFDHP